MCVCVCVCVYVCVCVCVKDYGATIGVSQHGINISLLVVFCPPIENILCVHMYVYMSVCVCVYILCECGVYSLGVVCFSSCDVCGWSPGQRRCPTCSSVSRRGEDMGNTKEG